MKKVLITFILLALLINITLKADDFNKALEFQTETIREKSSFGLSFDFYGIGLNFVVNPNINIEIVSSLFMNSIAVKYYTNRDSSWNFYTGIGAFGLYIPLNTVYGSIYMPIGIEYVADNGFLFAIDIRVNYGSYSGSTGYSPDRPEEENYQSEDFTGFLAWPAIKLGYMW